MEREKLTQQNRPYTVVVPPMNPHRDDPPKINLELIDFKISSLVQKIDSMQKQLDVSFVQRVEFDLKMTEVNLRTGRTEKILWFIGSSVGLSLIAAGMQILLNMKK